MGILSSAYTVLQQEVYQKIPDIQCLACGKCCVSPHVTLIEFCHMMTSLRDRPEFLARILSRVVPRHPVYPGHMLCRFQTPDGLCSLYPHRALTCRLHGNPVLRNAGLQYQVHCDKARIVCDPMTMEDVYALMDRVSELNQGYYSYYTPPYWVSGLNIESWLTILFTDIPQNIFRLLQKLIIRELDIQELSDYFNQKVRLREKIVLIDRFQQEMHHCNYPAALDLLEKIQNDFPDTGAYYYFEAEMYKKELEKQASSSDTPAVHKAGA